MAKTPSKKSAKAAGKKAAAGGAGKRAKRTETFNTYL